MIYDNEYRALLRFADQKTPQFGFYNHMCMILKKRNLQFLSPYPTDAT